MNPIVIIADDLTGAADTGVQFCPFFDHTVLISYLQFPARSDRIQAFPRGGPRHFTPTAALCRSKQRVSAWDPLPGGFQN